MVAQRFGVDLGNPITSDFPPKSRIALTYVLVDIDQKNYIRSDEMIQELNRIGRFTSKDLEEEKGTAFINRATNRLNKLEWYDVMNFCERVYEKYLHEVGNDLEVFVSMDEVRDYYSGEINQIMKEDNFAFSFEDGEFQRRGRPQTQKSIERVGTILSDPKLEKVKYHFNKAIRFFNIRPKPDVENCVKEALCALEAGVDILTDTNASLDFDKAIKELKGNGSRQISPPIADSMLKIHAYRGSGKGVAHAALTGNRVFPEDAELVLSLVAVYITYLADLFPPIDGVPF